MRKIFLAPATLALVLLSGVAVRAEDTQKLVVRDTTGDIVRAIGNNSCVRSNAPSATDECVQSPEMKTATVQTTHTVLTDDEKVVYFEFNKSTLTPAAKKKLEGVAHRLGQAKDVQSATIVGYADRIGKSDYNEKLSARRAETVKNFLVKSGYLNVNVADVRALGESHPVTSCPTNAPKAQQIACLSPDRRVELELVYTKDVTRTHEVMVPAKTTK